MDNESHLLPAHLNDKVTPKLVLSINNKKFPALLDTGASFCFIHSSVVKNLNASIVQTDLPEISLGDSTFITPTGKCSLNFSFSKIGFKHDFYILDNLPFSIILGADFIRSSELIINLSKGCCFFQFLPTAKIYFDNKDVLCALQGLNNKQLSQLNTLLSDYPDVMSNSVGCTNMVRCKLRVEGTPIAQKPYPASPFKQALIKEQVDKLLQLGFIRSSKSEWASPVNLRKQGENYRFCLDYRKLNLRTKSDPYPIPRMDTLLSKLGNSSFISKLDLRKGYWQIEMEKESIPFTAFICDQGKFEFLRMPFGLKTAPSIFQRFANELVGEARGIFADAYLDDIVVYSTSWEDHMHHIKFIMDRMRQAGVTANVEKCEFGKTHIKYLGFVITANGVSTDREKVAPIIDYPRPKSCKDVKRFLGLCGWYRHFIQNYADIISPLNILLRKSVKFKWLQVHEEAYNKLKSVITNATVLAYPDFTKTFTLRTDSSDAGLGAVLSQTGLDGNERPIAFASRVLTKTEASYHATEKECLAIVWALKKFECYLDGQEFILETDNRALTWLHSMKDASSKFMRWALKIQDFQPKIRHCPGKLNVVADALSRAPVGQPEEEEIKEVMDPPTNALFSMVATLGSSISREKLVHEQNIDLEVKTFMNDLPTNFSVVNNCLYRVNKNNHFLPFIPKSLRVEVLSYFHDPPHSGHMGFRKTIKRITSRVFWPNMHADIFSYVKTCAICQSTKNPMSKPHGDLKSISTNGPWDMLAIDLMGPLPNTKNRNCYILVVVDHFSKWVEIFALKNTQAPTICAILQNEIFCRWGTPKNLLSDNATYFRSKNFENMCASWGVKHRYTTPYHPQGNITERVNRNIRAMLASYIGSRHNNWDLHLPAVSLALRTAISDTTGYSPAMLNLGRDLKLPFDRHLEDEVNEFSSRSDFKSELIEKLISVYARARSSIEKAQKQQKHHYDKRHKRIQFQQGDLVLLRTHILSDKQKKITKKFACKWTGPYVITKCCSPLTYELSSLDKQTCIGTHNIQHLKPYHDRPSYADSFQGI